MAGKDDSGNSETDVDKIMSDVEAILFEELPEAEQKAMMEEVSPLLWIANITKWIEKDPDQEQYKEFREHVAQYTLRIEEVYSNLVFLPFSPLVLLQV